MASMAAMKSRLQKGDTLYGLFLCSFSPVLAEITAYAGYNFVVVGMEHGHDGISNALPCLQALSVASTPGLAILRLPRGVNSGKGDDEWSRRSSDWAKPKKRNGSNGPYLAGFAMQNDGPDELRARGYNMLSSGVDIGLYRNVALDDVKRFKMGLNPTREIDRAANVVMYLVLEIFRNRDGPYQQGPWVELGPSLARLVFKSRAPDQSWPMVLMG
ncbi:Phosphoenolpyruvate carboxylase family protein [Abeliophyllum distichum]|uniref:Phosphoenolpyruvate carboxylase family protein n=1 Tax=Abeliophyllum distichum TaxID=126358 RepID=A0ABD1TVB4_9LAMI